MQHTPKHLWIALWFVEGETNIDLKLIPSFLGTRCTKNKTKIQECKKKIINFLGSFWNIISSPLMFDKVLWLNSMRGHISTMRVYDMNYSGRGLSGLSAWHSDNCLDSKVEFPFQYMEGPLGSGVKHPPSLWITFKKDQDCLLDVLLLASKLHISFKYQIKTKDE